MVISVFFLMGCDLFADPQAEADRESVERFQQQMEADKRDQDKHKAEPDQVLASGDVLSVRVNYGDSGVSQCQVRIDNKRNDWYDEVEFWVDGEETLATENTKSQDYNFGSTNFNQQMTNEIKNPKFDDKEDIKGDYRVTVTASNGYAESLKVMWDGEQFTPNLLNFSLE